ncbi:aminoglycoside phosphotransferase family protein [Solicola sp. PLA-1-18]|uniref:aminoglycoside phosphotransferase family protein n=1 Tax=Solicola sp. PLA-1-18 TaxID=3380532 RepID=UPI003B7CDD37
MHVDQLTVTADVVRRLVDEQHPRWRHLPVRAVASQGTVNAIFRLGDDLAVRLPLQGDDPDATRAWLESERDAMAELAASTTVPTPVPVALGEPGAGYPLPWAVQTWLPGTDATADDPASSVVFARDMARLVLDLRAVDTRGRRFAGAGRGGHLPDHDAWMQECLRRSARLLDVHRLGLLWDELRVLPREDPDGMTHGDLVPGNVLVAGGRLTGVLDGGGFGPADPALDLVSAWHLLDAAPREELRRALGPSDLEWARGRAWAFQQAMGLVWYYERSNPGMSRLGRRTLRRLLERE